MDLPSAVQRYIRPGMAIQAGACFSFPNGFFREMLRQFWGKRGDFTLISSVAVSANLALFVHGGLCKKVIASFMGDGLPYPGPNPVFQRAHREGVVEFEHWTMLTLNQRLAAGAMNLPFFPTRSMAESSIALERDSEFTVIEDPFEKGKIGLVKALKPDISIIHGLAADEEGNILLTPPFATSLYGAMAAREGVIATVEKVVDLDLIKRHADSLVKIPASAILCVCEVPFGAHPLGCHNFGISEINGYGEDVPYMLELREACKKKEDLNEWIERWILNCKTPGEYLEKLGESRCSLLIDQIKISSTDQREISELKPPENMAPLSEKEKMILAGTRKIAEIAIKEDYQSILAGIGASSLACWVAYYLLQREGVATSLMSEVGSFGYKPFPGDPFVFNMKNLPTSSLHTDTMTIMGIFLSHGKNRCLGVLGAAQIDREGNINTTVIPEKNLFLLGSGGGNDIASQAGEVIIIAQQSKNRFLERVPYITSPGKRVTTVISQFGIYKKREGELVLTEVLAGGESIEEEARRAKDNCGWPLKISPELKWSSDPSPPEIAILRGFDPKKYFL